MKHRIRAAILLASALPLALMPAHAAEEPSWAWRDYRIVVKYLMGDSPVLSPCFDPPHDGDSQEPPSMCSVPTALDFRVSLTPSAMVVGAGAQPTAYRAMASIRHIMHTCCGDAATWLPSAGSHVVFVGWNDNITPRMDGPAPGPYGDVGTDSLYKWLVPADISGIPSWFFDTDPTGQGEGNVLARVLLTRVAFDAVNFMAPLSGDAGEPPVVTPARGQLWLHASSGQLSIDYTLLLFGIQGPFELHIHQDTADLTALPLVGIRHPDPRDVPLFLASGTINAAWLATPLTGGMRGLLRALRAGEIYADIHTTPFPAGELRGHCGAY